MYFIPPWFSVKLSSCPNLFLSLLRKLYNILLISPPYKAFVSLLLLPVIVMKHYIVITYHMSHDLFKHFVSIVFVEL